MLPRVYHVDAILHTNNTNGRVALFLYSQADWCNNCGFIHRSMKFSACLDNVPRQIYSYGANRNNVYVSLGSHFTKWLPKEHCGRIVFSILRQNQLLLNDSTYPNSRQCAWNNF